MWSGLLRIERIEMIPIRVPLPFTYSGSYYRMRNRCTIITRVHTADGIVGEAYNADEDSPIQEEVLPVLRKGTQRLKTGLSEDTLDCSKHLD